MTVMLGAETITGAGIETVRGTPVAATQKLKLISNELDVETNYKQDETLCGDAGRGLPRKGTDVLSGTLVEELTYDLQSLLLEQAFGSYVDEVTGEDHYDLVSRTATSLTVASLMHDTQVHEYDNVTTGTLEIVGSTDTDVQVSCTAMGGTRTRTGTVNTSVSLGLLASRGPTVRFNELRLRIGTVAAGALGPGDEWQDEVNAFTLTVERNLVQNEVGSEITAQATENGKRDVTLSITFAQFDWEDFIDWKESQTNIQAELFFTQFGSNETKAIRLPVGRVTSSPKAITGPELATSTVEMQFALNDGFNSETDFDFPEEVRIFEEDPP